MMPSKYYIIVLLALFSLFINIGVYAGSCIPGTPGCSITGVNYTNCAMNYPLEYRNIDGVIVAPVNSTISAYANTCSITITYHNDANSWMGSYTTTYTPYLYITGRPVSITSNISVSEGYTGTPQDIINGLNYATRDFYTGYKTVIYGLSTSYVPSITQALSTINYGNPLNDLFFEVTIPTLKNLANSNPHITYTNISTAVAILTYTYPITHLSDSLVITPSVHSGKVLIEDPSGNILYSATIPSDCSELKIQNGKVYCGDQLKVDRTFRVSYVVNNTTYYIVEMHPFVVTFKDEVYYENVFQYFNTISGTDRVTANVNINVNMPSETTVVCDHCQQYKFTHPGIYYVTYTGYPKIVNEPFLIVKPLLSGTYHTTIYPVSKVETHNLFNIKTIGIGLHNVTIYIGNTYHRTLTLNENTKLLGNITLDFKHYKLFIEYYKNGSFIRKDYVMPLTQCIHKDCNISYKIYYDDGYGFHSIPRRLFGRSYIHIKWDNLTYSVPKVIIHDSKQFVIPINVTNLGPVPAEDVNIYNIKYNASCISLYPGTSVNILPGRSAIIYLYGRIRNFYCKSSGYNFTFNIYGWNTHLYTVNSSIPVSIIEFPPSGTTLTNLVIFNIRDVNTNKCTIYINRNKYLRSCDSNFLYNNYCTNPGICIINVSSTNSNFTFYSKQYIYSIPNLASKGIVSSYTPNTLYLKQGVPSNIYVVLSNTLDTPIKCTIGIDTNLLVIKNILKDNSQVNSLPFSFTISPKSSTHFLINIQAIKLGMENTKIHFSCSENRRIDIIIPTVVYKNKIVSGSVKSISANEKMSYLAILGVVGAILII